LSTLLEQPRTNAGRPLNLPGNQAHLWCFSLSLLPGEEERIWEWLSEDERKRAERFHFRKHREHFIKARGVLRKVLAGYISTTPERVQFRYTAWGKPSLAEGEPIKFNLSHSGEKGLLGIARVEIGVDIEEIRPMAERDFSVSAKSRPLSGLRKRKRTRRFTAYGRGKKRF
jgi:4'-phosphopantetheinyl transferase